MRSLHRNDIFFFFFSSLQVQIRVTQAPAGRGPVNGSAVSRSPCFEYTGNVHGATDTAEGVVNSGDCLLLCEKQVREPPKDPETGGTNGPSLLGETRLQESGLPQAAPRVSNSALGR